MKIKNLVLLAFVLTVVIQGCDEIDAPYGNGSNGGGVIDTTGVDTLANDTLQRVLLEEYTGHLCVNCPPAHQSAQALHNLYGEQLVIVAIHAGYYARTESGSYSYDWKTPVGDAIYGRFMPSSQPFPTGCVMRTKVGGNYPVAHGTWGANIAPYITQKASAKLRITSTYDAANKTISSTVTTGILKDISTSLMLNVLYTEDSIVRFQKNGNVNVPDYTHRHALRGTLNGNFGTVLGASFTTGQSLTQTYTSTPIQSDVVPKHVSVVAILYNTTTWEVVQVAEKKLVP